MKKIIIIISICLVVAASGVLVGLYIIGDKIIDETLDIELEEVQQDISVVDTSPATEAGVALEPESEQKTQQVSAASAQGQTATSTDENKSKESESTDARKPAITVNKMKEIKEQVTAQDKVSVASMVMSKLSTTEVNKLQGMLSGGLTAEEKAEAKRVAFANFSAEEIKKIKEIYYKYMNN